MFTDEQIKLLQAPLERKHVAQRKQGGMSLSYIEGYHAIDEANRIFGFGNWTLSTTRMECVSNVPVKVGAKQEDGYEVGYLAIVTIGIGTLYRQGTGFGSGVAKSLKDAHESASKEAETDAMKRALRTFGNAFGNALYDKQQRSVVDTVEDELKSKDGILEAIKKAKTVAELSSLKTRVSGIVNGFSAEDKSEVVSQFNTTKKSLEDNDD
jgi:DNA recombination protein Rad52